MLFVKHKLYVVTLALGLYSSLYAMNGSPSSHPSPIVYKYNFTTFAGSINLSTKVGFQENVYPLHSLLYFNLSAAENDDFKSGVTWWASLTDIKKKKYIERACWGFKEKESRHQILKAFFDLDEAIFDALLKLEDKGVLPASMHPLNKIIAARSFHAKTGVGRVREETMLERLQKLKIKSSLTTFTVIESKIFERLETQNLTAFPLIQGYCEPFLKCLEGLSPASIPMPLDIQALQAKLKEIQEPKQKNVMGKALSVMTRAVTSSQEQERQKQEREALEAPIRTQIQERKEEYQTLYGDVIAVTNALNEASQVNADVINMAALLITPEMSVEDRIHIIESVAGFIDAHKGILLQTDFIRYAHHLTSIQKIIVLKALANQTLNNAVSYTSTQDRFNQFVESIGTQDLQQLIQQNDLGASADQPVVLDDRKISGADVDNMDSKGSSLDQPQRQRLPNNNSSSISSLPSDVYLEGTSHRSRAAYHRKQERERDAYWYGYYDGRNGYGENYYYLLKYNNYYYGYQAGKYDRKHPDQHYSLQDVKEKFKSC